MKNFTHHYLLSNKKIEPFKDRIESALKSAEEKTLKKLQEITVDVVIMHCPHKTIPELGIVGSYTKEVRLIEIAIDVNNEYLKENLEEEIERTFAHEYMHAAREEYLQSEKGTLLEAFVSEGLCQSFEIEINPHTKPAIYATYLSEKELQDAFDKAKPLFNETQYDHNTWFFGNEEKGIKKWIGYSLGYWLVRQKMKKDGKMASELVGVESKEFVI